MKSRSASSGVQVDRAESAERSAERVSSDPLADALLRAAPACDIDGTCEACQ